MCNRLRPNPFPNLDGGRSVACLGGATASIGHRVLRRRHVRRTVVRSRRAESLQPVASCNGAIRAGTGGLLAAGRRQYVVGDWAGGVHGRGWFLWGTGIFTAGEQSRLAAEFQERLLAISDLTALPLGDGASAAASEIVIPVAWDDPVIQVANTISAELEAIPDLAGVMPELAPQPGAALGRIVIPKAEIDWIIVEGVTPGIAPQTEHRSTTSIASSAATRSRSSPSPAPIPTRWSRPGLSSPTTPGSPPSGKGPGSL